MAQITQLDNRSRGRSEHPSAEPSRADHAVQPEASAVAKRVVRAAEPDAEGADRGRLADADRGDRATPGGVPGTLDARGRADGAEPDV